MIHELKLDPMKIYQYSVNRRTALSTSCMLLKKVLWQCAASCTTDDMTLPFFFFCHAGHMPKDG